MGASPAAAPVAKSTSDILLERGAALLPYLFATVLVVFFLSPIERILSTGMVEDDAFYYMKIAANAAAGQGSTFDGLSRTNGYHPLWLILLVPVYAIAGCHLTLALRVVCLLGLVLLLFSALIWQRILRQAFEEPSAVALGTVIFCFLSFFASSHGMETSLLMLVTTAFLRFLIRRDPLALTASSRDELVAGVLLALAFLARLDMVFLGFVVVASVLAQAVRHGWPPRRAMGKALRLVIPCVVLSAPYLAWNLYRFGHLVPISGTLKSSFPRPGPYPYVLVHLGPHLVFSMLVGVFLILAGLARKRDANRVAGSLRLLSAALLFQVLYAFLFEKWGFAHWQVAPAFLLGSYGGAWIFERILREGRRRVGAGKLRAAGALGVVFALIVALGFGVRSRLTDRDSFYLAEYEAALWSREHLPPDAILAAKSDAGLFSYFSQRRVMNINDGLVNSFVYQEVVKEKRLMPYLEGEGVRWLFVSVNPQLVRDGKFGTWVQSHLHDVYSEEFPIPLATAVYRSRVVPVHWGSGELLLTIVPFPLRQP